MNASGGRHEPAFAERAGASERDGPTVREGAAGASTEVERTRAPRGGGSHVRPEPPGPGGERAGTGWWRSHNVRVRLTLWYLAVMIVVLAVYAAAVTTVVTRTVREALDEQLRHEFNWVVASIYRTPEGEFTLNEHEPIEPEETLPWVQVWNYDGSELLFQSGEAQRRPVPESQLIQSEGLVSIPTDTVPMRILTRRITFLRQQGAVSDERVIIQVGRSEERMRDQLRQLALILIVGLPVPIAVAGLGGYALARRALAPIERMTAHARTITAERLNDRLPVDNPEDEMGRLAEVFNETLARLEESFEQMRRFTADVSHQLRTPLTALRSVGEVGLRNRRDEASYRAIIGSMLEEADRLATLVDRLLTLSRAETRQAVALGPVDLVELAEQVAADLGVLAEEKRQKLTVDGPPHPVGARADRLGVRQALMNLVDNAIKFTPSGGAVRIRVAEDTTHAVIEVIDSGPGVPVTERDRIFDRFYRVDSVEAGGTGLGLSIAKGAVEAGGGHLSLEAAGPEGSTFRITLPGTTLTKNSGTLQNPGSRAGARISL
jgi:heavy metal sensor kinase